MGTLLGPKVPRKTHPHQFCSERVSFDEITYVFPLFQALPTFWAEPIEIYPASAPCRRPQIGPNGPNGHKFLGASPPDPHLVGLRPPKCRPSASKMSAFGLQMGPRAPTDPPKWIPQKWLPKWDPNGSQTNRAWSRLSPMPSPG